MRRPRHRAAGRVRGVDPHLELQPVHKNGRRIQTGAARAGRVRRVPAVSLAAMVPGLVLAGRQLRQATARGVVPPAQAIEHPPEPRAAEIARPPERREAEIALRPGPQERADRARGVEVERLRAAVRRRPAPGLLEVAVVRSVAAAGAARDHRALGVHRAVAVGAAEVEEGAAEAEAAEEEDGDKLETQTLNFESHEDQNAVNGVK